MGFTWWQEIPHVAVMLLLDFDGTDPERGSALIVTIVTGQQLPPRRKIPREQSRTVELIVASSFPNKTSKFRSNKDSWIDAIVSVCFHHL